jgi:hypothetical protein
MKAITLILTLISAHAFASKPTLNVKKEIKYKTQFNGCPAQAVGKLTLDLVHEFDKKRSLLNLKKMIVKKNLEEKYFLSEYKINFDPSTQSLKFIFNCPKPLMKAQIYKKNGEEYYTAILVDTGKFVDPAYEVLLRAEKKLTTPLPSLAYPVSMVNDETLKTITALTQKFNQEFKNKLSEVILNEDKSLTMIFSINRKPSSAFLGNDYWSEKVEKLTKVIDFMKKKKKVPAVINLTNSKKIVVKFSDSI